jgi:hypothetical protein
MMGMHSEDVVVGGSVVAGAASVALAELSLLVVVLSSAKVVFNPDDPVSVAAASTTRAPGI